MTAAAMLNSLLHAGAGVTATSLQLSEASSRQKADTWQLQNGGYCGWRHPTAELAETSRLTSSRTSLSGLRCTRLHGSQPRSSSHWAGRNLAGRSLAGRSSQRRVTVSAASEDSPKVVYNGTYGPWSVENVDRLEVLAYRAGLVTAAGSFLAASSTPFLPADSPLLGPLLSSLDVLYALGAAGLGAALVLIHIYVTPIKRTLQLLWLVGALGSLGVAANFAGPQGKGLVEFVLESPGAIWAVGPLFAALTGLVFKEGLCYGKLEAAALFFVIPSLLLGHLSGAMSVDVEKGLLLAWMALFTLFAARKFSQPIKDDIGDKSVFLFQALPPEQQQALIAKLRGGVEPDSEPTV